MSREAWIAWGNGVLRNANFQVGAGVVVFAVVIGAVGFVLGAQAKEIISVATAIAGLSTIAVGLALSKDAFKLLYDKEAHQSAPDGEAPPSTAMRSVATSLTTIPGVVVDLNELLPKLITRAAGLAIAVLLLGVLLLAGASFSAPGGESASPSPGPSSGASPSVAPSGSPGAWLRPFTTPATG
jgi:hypothetical protein